MTLNAVFKHLREEILKKHIRDSHSIILHLKSQFPKKTYKLQTTPPFEDQKLLNEQLFRQMRVLKPDASTVHGPNYLCRGFR